MIILACFQQIPSQITAIRHKPSRTTHHISQNPIPVKLCEKEVYPNLKFEVSQRRGALHDSENGFRSRFGAEMVSKGWSFDGGRVEEDEDMANFLNITCFERIKQPVFY